MTTLLFARHGQASFGHRNYDKLSELGVKQSALLGAHYAQAQRKIDLVISGDLKRHRDSISHFITGYENHYPVDEVMSSISLNSIDSKDSTQSTTSKLSSTDPFIIEGLNEFDHRDILTQLDPSFTSELAILAAIANAPVPKLRLAELFKEAMLRWHSAKYDDDYQESWQQFNQRVQKALLEIIAHAKQQDAKNVLVFTSGGVIAAIAAGLLTHSNLGNSLVTDHVNQHNLKADSLSQSMLYQQSMTAYQLSRSLINTSITSIILKSDKPRLLSYNEHSHLYKDGKNYISWQ